MAWYYVLNGSRQGPVEVSELQSLRQKNIISLDTLVWTDGMPEWTPFQTSPAASQGVVGGAVILAHDCAECGRTFPEDEMLQYENKWVCATCKPVFFQRIKEGVALKNTLNYATVGTRFVAVFIDWIINCLVIFTPLIFLLGGADFFVRRSIRVTIIMQLWNYGFPAFYETFFMGRYGATPGKMVFRIKVVMPNGQPITYMRALGRYFAKYISKLICMIGYLMAFWDEERRALHDRICNTRVIVTEPS